jgi:hypothetical protein
LCNNENGREEANKRFEVPWGCIDATVICSAMGPEGVEFMMAYSRDGALITIGR